MEYRLGLYTRESFQEPSLIDGLRRVLVERRGFAFEWIQSTSGWTDPDHGVELDPEEGWALIERILTHPGGGHVYATAWDPFELDLRIHPDFVRFGEAAREVRFNEVILFARPEGSAGVDVDLVEVLVDLAEVLKGHYGRLCARKEFHAAPGQAGDVSRALARCLPGLFWANYWSAELCTSLGLDRTGATEELGRLCHRVTRLGDRGLLVVLYETPEEASTEESRQCRATVHRWLVRGVVAMTGRSLDVGDDLSVPLPTVQRPAQPAPCGPGRGGDDLSVPLPTVQRGGS